LTSWFLGIVLGLVQGISEWLPISSKTQVIIASSYLFGLTFSQAYALGLFLEAGSFVAAVLYFRKEVLEVLKALVGRGTPEGSLLLKFLVVVTAVTAFLGVGIYQVVSSSIVGPVLGLPMIVLGLVLVGDGVVITYSKGRYTPTKGLADLSLRDILLIGLAQGVAAFPGVSRSGATVSAMLLLGVKPADAFRLSFLALIPASVGAAGVTVLLSKAALGATLVEVGLTVILLSIIVSVVVSVLAIRVLLRFAGSGRIGLVVFALGVLAIFGGVSSILSGSG
jgi:undecaprenyl-diphosphatase